MRQERFGFVGAFDSVKLRGCALSQTFKLWKDVPHPVAALAAAADFGECAGIVGFLRFDKSIETGFVGRFVMHAIGVVGPTGFEPVTKRL